MVSVQPDIGASRYQAGSEHGSLAQREHGTNCEAMLFPRVCAYQLWLPMSLDAGLGSWPEAQSNQPADGNIYCLTRILIQLKRNID